MGDDFGQTGLLLVSAGTGGTPAGPGQAGEASPVAERQSMRQQDRVAAEEAVGQPCLVLVRCPAVAGGDQQVQGLT